MVVDTPLFPLVDAEVIRFVKDIPWEKADYVYLSVLNSRDPKTNMVRGERFFGPVFVKEKQNGIHLVSCHGFETVDYLQEVIEKNVLEHWISREEDNQISWETLTKYASDGVQENDPWRTILISAFTETIMTLADFVVLDKKNPNQELERIIMNISSMSKDNLIAYKQTLKDFVLLYNQKEVYKEKYESVKKKILEIS